MQILVQFIKDLVFILCALSERVEAETLFLLLFILIDFVMGSLSLVVQTVFLYRSFFYIGDFI